MAHLTVVLISNILEKKLMRSTKKERIDTTNRREEITKEHKLAQFNKLKQELGL